MAVVPHLKVACQMEGDGANLLWPRRALRLKEEIAVGKPCQQAHLTVLGRGHLEEASWVVALRFV